MEEQAGAFPMNIWRLESESSCPLVKAGPKGHQKQFGADQTNHLVNRGLCQAMSSMYPTALPNTQTKTGPQPEIIGGLQREKGIKGLSLSTRTTR